MKGGLTELGCVACEELGALGAGKEGWLQINPNLILAITSQSVALANKSLLVILTWNGDEGPKIIIRPALSSEGDITAIEWLAFDQDRTLALGTSQGFLLIYSSNGDLLHKQMLHPCPIIRLRVRGSSGRPVEAAASDELCIVFPAAILRIDASDLQSLLKRCLEEKAYNARFPISAKKDTQGLEDVYGKLKYQLWNVSKCGPCSDAAITGIMAPPLMEDQSRQQYYCAITVGANAAFAAFRLSEDKNKSLVGAILSKVMPATVSTITSFAKMFWWSDQTDSRPAEVKPQAFARASLLTCLKDEQRKGERLSLSPGGCLAAVTDSLGRILLIDTQALVVVKLWKGYRDASCFFLEVPLNGGTPSVDGIGYGKSKHDFCLCLAIHAPRKGVVEVWKMRTGGCIMAQKCAKGCQLLQPSCKLTSLLSHTYDYDPAQVYLLNGDSGQIAILNPIIPPS